MRSVSPTATGTLSGSQRNCWTIGNVPRDTFTGLRTDAPPSTKYTPNLGVISTLQRPRNATIAPLPQARAAPRAVSPAERVAHLFDAESTMGSFPSKKATRHRVKDSKAGTPVPSPGPWKRDRVRPDDEAGLLRALREFPVDKHWTTPNNRCKWSSTPVPRGMVVGGSVFLRADSPAARNRETPPPGAYEAKPSSFERSTASTSTGPRGSIGKALRFANAESSSVAPGPGAYNPSTVPRTNVSGTNFSAGADRFHAQTVAAEKQARAVPGPASYTREADGAFARASSRLAYELSTVSATFLAQRIPFDPSVQDKQVVSDVRFVREVAKEIARHQLRD